MILKCKKCKNEWQYKGNNPYYATCSRCLNKVKVEEIKKGEE
jgi:N-acetylneuraminic acid mutarotase